MSLKRLHGLRKSVASGQCWAAIGVNFVSRNTSGATKDYHRATDAHFRPDKPRDATGKLLIVLNPWLTLNHRVPGSSPGAPTKLFKQLADFTV